MKLAKAVICLDCDEVYEDARLRSPTDHGLPKSNGCPSCGCQKYHPLSRWLAPMNSEPVVSKSSLQLQCSNCGHLWDIHCKKHTIPCCPGKCSL